MAIFNSKVLNYQRDSRQNARKIAVDSKHLGGLLGAVKSPSMSPKKSEKTSYHGKPIKH